MICFDELGPLELKPLGGVTWARRRRPQRMRATYHRRKGTEVFLGFYDVHADCLSGLFRHRKRQSQRKRLPICSKEQITFCSFFLSY